MFCAKQCKDNLGKFDAKSDEAVFIGYSFHNRAYKVFNKRTMCVESTHVLFDETDPSSEFVQKDDDILELEKSKNQEAAEKEKLLEKKVED